MRAAKRIGAREGGGDPCLLLHLQPLLGGLLVQDLVNVGVFAAQMIHHPPSGLRNGGAAGQRREA